ncbi:MAG: VOC family protein [Acidobacteriota bacterium]|nr:VOC family protein [Acidobacteriota bacterium]
MNADTTTETNVRQAVPFFRVSTMEDSLRFYVDGLGFVMTDRWIDDGKLRWCWLELGGAAVMLEEFKREGRDSWVPPSKVGVGVSIFFICRDALALYREFVARGVKARRPFVGNSMWVTSLEDPDGYQIHFESLTDAPEDSQYEE